MTPMVEGLAGGGLARSCDGTDWVWTSEPGEGVALLRARFGGRAFARHRHDTYAIGVTEDGVQAFDYRGRIERSTRGQVVVLHPDEMHDGRAGTDAGFGYRIVYVEPARIAAAVRTLAGRPAALPFVREPVSWNSTLARAVTSAFRLASEPLALDALVLHLAEGLLEGDPGSPAARPPRRLDHAALERARALLDGRRAVVRSVELEAVTGLSRYELARQFRAAYGTSPYRYSLMRRLDFARKQLDGGTPLAELALAAGFSDQAHFTRMFGGAFGLTPGRYARLRAADASRERPGASPASPGPPGSRPSLPGGGRGSGPEALRAIAGGDVLVPAVVAAQG
jgi:AraC-like DNA-binding protein